MEKWLLFLAGILICVSLVIGFFACETGDDDDDSGGNSDDDTSDDDTTDDDSTDDDDSSDDDDDVWTDSATGLIWQKTMGTDCWDEWDDAKEYCQNLNWGGHDNWRLPTISELRSLIRGCDATATGGSCGVTDSCLDGCDCYDSDLCGCTEGSGPANGCYWPPELEGKCGTYWSSSENEYCETSSPWDSVWFVGFESGNILSGDKIINTCCVRCVRN